MKKEDRPEERVSKPYTNLRFALESLFVVLLILGLAYWSNKQPDGWGVVNGDGFIVTCALLVLSIGTAFGVRVTGKEFEEERMGRKSLRI